jgi:hypothetical protein
MPDHASIWHLRQKLALKGADEGTGGERSAARTRFRGTSEQCFEVGGRQGDQPVAIWFPVHGSNRAAVTCWTLISTHQFWLASRPRPAAREVLPAM